MLCINCVIRGVIGGNVFRSLARNMEMNNRKKNKQQIDMLKSLICRSGVSSRHRSLLASYESANRLPDNVSSVHTLSAGFSITQIRRVSAAESQRPHNESNKRLTIFE